jgi:hypothetical protein
VRNIAVAIAEELVGHSPAAQEETAATLADDKA